MSALRGNGRVHACGVALKQMKLVRRKSRESTVRSGPDLQSALGTIVRNERCTENLRKISSSMAAQRIHLPQPILRGHVALGHHEVVERTRPKMWNPMCIALHRNRSGEAGDRDRAVQLRQGIVQRLPGPVTPIKEPNCNAKNKKHGENTNQTIKDPSASNLQGGPGFFRGGGGDGFVRIHGLIEV